MLAIQITLRTDIAGIIIRNSIVRIKPKRGRQGNAQNIYLFQDRVQKSTILIYVQTRHFRITYPESMQQVRHLRA